MATTTPAPTPGDIYPPSARTRSVLRPVGTALSVLGTLGIFLGMHALIAAAAGGFLLAVMSFFGG